MIAWYTNHYISQKVMLSIKDGFNVISKDTSLFKEGVKKNMFKEEAILYGILRGCSDVIHYNFRNNLDYLHIDKGYIGDNHFTGYYRISLNDTQARYKEIDLPDDRRLALNKYFTLKDWQKKDGYYLIVPPTEAIAIFYGIDIKKWIDTTIHKLAGKPHKIRQKNDLSNIPLENDLAQAKCVITFNSNVALDATIAGVPVIATSQHSVIKNWNNLTMINLDDCYDKSILLDRKKLLNFIAYHQFTLTEIERGLAKAIIKKMREKNVY